MFTKEEEEEISNAGENLRGSKVSRDHEEDFGTEPRRKKSLSESSERSLKNGQ